MKPMRRWLPVFALCLVLPGCATSHLIAWSKGEPSAFNQPPESKSIYVRPGAAVLAFPVTVVWDVVTLPFQYFWDIYPYGNENAPTEREEGQ